MQRIEIQWERSAKPHVGLDTLEMRGSGFNPMTVGLNGLGWYVELSRHIDHRLPRRQTEVIRRKPQIAQRTELQGEAETGSVLALLVDDPMIVVG
jgi:hypothetical protein